MLDYRAPRITELGSLGVLTQSLLPSTRALGGTMAALSSPIVVSGAAGSGNPAVSNPGNAASINTPAAAGHGSVPADVVTPASGSSPSSGTDAANGTLDGGGGTAAAPIATPGTPTAAPAGDGNLPFTGFAAGAVAAAGAGLASIGVAIRRATARRH